MFFLKKKRVFRFPCDQTLDFFIHESSSYQYFLMKIDMDAPKYITKLKLNWFESMSFCFGMRAKL